MNQITYRNSFIEATVPLGKDYDFRREENCVDVILRRDVAIDLPLTVAIQVKTDGTIRWWYSEFEQLGLGSVYWHFSPRNIIDPLPACTDAQREVLRRFQSEGMFGLGGHLGHPVMKWAFGEEAARIAAAYHS